MLGSQEGRLLQTLQILEKWEENTKNTFADKFNNLD